VHRPCVLSYLLIEVQSWMNLFSFYSSRRHCSIVYNFCLLLLLLYISFFNSSVSFLSKTLQPSTCYLRLAHVFILLATFWSIDEFHPLANVISKTPIQVTTFNKVFSSVLLAIVPLSCIKLIVGLIITKGNANIVKKMGPMPLGWSLINKYMLKPPSNSVK